MSVSFTVLKLSTILICQIDFLLNIVYTLLQLQVPINKLHWGREVCEGVRDGVDLAVLIQLRIFISTLKCITISEISCILDPAWYQ